MKTELCMGVKIGYNTMRQKILINELRIDIKRLYDNVGIFNSLDNLYYTKISTTINYMLSKNMLDITGFNIFYDNLIFCIEHHDATLIFNVYDGVLNDSFADEEIF